MDVLITARRCVVTGCDKTEDNMACYRFPREKEEALKWKESLQLRDYPLEVLQSTYVVCTNHFSPDDYVSISKKTSEARLKSSAIPKLEKNIPTSSSSVATSPATNESASVELITPTRNLSLPPLGCMTSAPYVLNLPPIPPKDSSLKKLNEEMRAKHEKSNSNSTSNSEICLLPIDESHFESSTLPKAAQKRKQIANIIMPSEMHKSGRKSTTPTEAMSKSCQLNTTPTDAMCKSVRKSNTPTASESDIEVLKSGEATGVSNYFDEQHDVHVVMSPNGLKILKRELQSLKKSSGNVSEASSDNSQDSKKTQDSDKIKQQESTDQDVSVDELSHNSNSGNLNDMTRRELLSIIRDQAARILQLEDQVMRYKNAQRTIFKCVDELRATLAAAGESDKSQ